jgi:hypothetical protein
MNRMMKFYDFFKWDREVGRTEVGVIQPMHKAEIFKIVTIISTCTINIC